MPQLNDVPYWVEDTPSKCDYTLTMWDSDGDNAQEIHISRREFKAAKRMIAKMRGYLPPKPDPNVPNDAASVFERGRKLVQESHNA